MAGKFGLRFWYSNPLLTPHSKFRPANFGKDNAGPLSIPSLIVAGAISPLSGASRYSGPTDGIPHFYAPGQLVVVPNGNPQLGNNQYRLSDGTSDGMCTAPWCVP